MIHRRAAQRRLRGYRRRPGAAGAADRAPSAEIDAEIQLLAERAVRRRAVHPLRLLAALVVRRPERWGPAALCTVSWAVASNQLPEWEERRRLGAEAARAVSAAVALELDRRPAPALSSLPPRELGGAVWACATTAATAAGCCAALSAAKRRLGAGPSGRPGLQRVAAAALQLRNVCRRRLPPDEAAEVAAGAAGATQAVVTAAEADPIPPADSAWPGFIVTAAVCHAGAASAAVAGRAAECGALYWPAAGLASVLRSAAAAQWLNPALYDAAAGATAARGLGDHADGDIDALAWALARVQYAKLPGAQGPDAELSARRQAAEERAARGMHRGDGDAPYAREGLQNLRPSELAQASQRFPSEAVEEVMRRPGISNQLTVLPWAVRGWRHGQVGTERIGDMLVGVDRMADPRINSLRGGAGCYAMRVLWAAAALHCVASPTATRALATAGAGLVETGCLGLLAWATVMGGGTGAAAAFPCAVEEAAVRGGAVPVREGVRLLWAATMVGQLAAESAAVLAEAVRRDGEGMEGIDVAQTCSSLIHSRVECPEAVRAASAALSRGGAGGINPHGLGYVTTYFAKEQPDQWDRVLAQVAERAAAEGFAQWGGQAIAATALAYTTSAHSDRRAFVTWACKYAQGLPEGIRGAGSRCVLALYQASASCDLGSVELGPDWHPGIVRAVMGVFDDFVRRGVVPLYAQRDLQWISRWAALHGHPGKGWITSLGQAAPPRRFRDRRQWYRRLAEAVKYTVPRPCPKVGQPRPMKQSDVQPALIWSPTEPSPTPPTPLTPLRGVGRTRRRTRIR